MLISIYINTVTAKQSFNATKMKYTKNYTNFDRNFRKQNLGGAKKYLSFR